MNQQINFFIYFCSYLIFYSLVSIHSINYLHINYKKNNVILKWWLFIVENILLTYLNIIMILYSQLIKFVN